MGFNTVGFKFKLKKWKFGKILCQIINQQGIKLNQEGLTAIKNFTTPKNLNKHEAFLDYAVFLGNSYHDMRR